MGRATVSRRSLTPNPLISELEGLCQSLDTSDAEVLVDEAQCRKLQSQGLERIAVPQYARTPKSLQLPYCILNVPLNVSHHASSVHRQLAAGLNDLAGALLKELVLLQVELWKLLLLQDLLRSGWAAASFCVQRS